MGTLRTKIDLSKRKYSYSGKLYHEPTFVGRNLIPDGQGTFSDYRLPLDMFPPQVFQFDEVGLAEGRARIKPSEANIKTKVGSYEFDIPLMPSPMMCVTDDRSAIKGLQRGLLPVVHANCTQDEHIRMVEHVKRAESYIIRGVMTISPDQTVEEARDLMKNYAINGLPVTDDGSSSGFLLGILTHRDVDHALGSLPVSAQMTPFDKLVLAYEDQNIQPNDATQRLSDSRKEKLPIIDRTTQRLTGLITMKDIRLKESFPQATRTKDGSLVCATAIGVEDLERAKKLDKYVDIFVLDSSHGWSDYYISRANELMKSVRAEFIVGNVASYQAAEAFLTELDPDKLVGIRTGKGSGSICITNQQIGQGVPLLTATTMVAEAVNDYGACDKVAVIADGGIRYGSDIVKCFVAGARAVMIGKLFAATEESPAEVVQTQDGPRKVYFGEGSRQAMDHRDTKRYSSKKHEEGGAILLPITKIDKVVPELASAIQAGISAYGCTSIRDMNLDSKLFSYQGTATAREMAIQK